MKYTARVITINTAFYEIDAKSKKDVNKRLVSEIQNNCLQPISLVLDLSRIIDWDSIKREKKK